MQALARSLEMQKGPAEAGQTTLRGERFSPARVPRAAGIPELSMRSNLGFA
jgi:hypothetical protein